MNKNLFALLILILALATALAASAAPPGPPGATRPGGDLPSITPPGSGLGAQTQLLLPKTLIINDFVITNVTYDAKSTLNNATGQGKGVFTGAGDEFTLNFAAVEIQSQGQQGRIVKGTITKDFNPLLPVDPGPTGRQSEKAPSHACRDQGQPGSSPPDPLDARENPQHP